MDRQTARIVIVVVTLGVVFYVLSSMMGSHYYRATYGICLARGPFFGSDCKQWTLQAIFEILAVIAIAVGFWIYNDKRIQGTK